MWWENFGLKMGPACKAWSLLLLVAHVGFASHAQSLTLDFPDQSEEVPAGLADFPRESFHGLATIEIPLLPVEKEGSILVSVVFLDDVERVIQAKWKAGEKETVLSANLSEGVRAWNRRALRIPSDLLSETGMLVLETDAPLQPVRRVNLAWMWPGGVYMGNGAHAVEYVSDPNTVLTIEDLSDAKPAPVPDSVANGIWKASLQENIEPLDEGVQFEVPMKVPQAAIFRAKILGFPLSAVPVFSANGEKLASVGMEIPTLDAPGFFKDESGEMGFAGWREVAVVIPSRVFQAGLNAMVVEGKKGAYIKDARLELNYDEEGAPLEPFEGRFGGREDKPLASVPFENILPGLEAPLDKEVETAAPTP
jgi:hypothetical protein